jgi:hypothetical protein
VFLARLLGRSFSSLIPGELLSASALFYTSNRLYRSASD